MIKVYIDESGNMGTGGKYFILGALVVKDKETETKLSRIIKKEQMTDLKGQKIFDPKRKREVKFSRMKFTQRQRIVNKLSRLGVDIYYFVAYKPSVSLLEDGSNRNLTYNYFCKLLLKRVLRRYGDDFEIVFDQRTTAVKSMWSLNDYIKISAYEDFPHLKGRKISVKQADSKTNKLLQMADIVAGAGAQAYVVENTHFLNMLGEKIKMVDEFPKTGFLGKRKTMIIGRNGLNGKTVKQGESEK